MEFLNFKVEMYYGENFESPWGFIGKLEESYITTTMKEFQ